MRAILTRKTTIIILFVISILAAYLYSYFKVPAGVVPQGADTELQSWISLVISIISLLTALVGLAKSIIDQKAKK